jgi:hypothetical protein
MTSQAAKLWFERANASRPKLEGILALKRVTIRSKVKGKNDSRLLCSHLIAFCKQSNVYRFLRDESHELSSAGLLDAVVMHRLDREPHPILAFASTDGATLSLTNVVPQTVSSINWESYNSFAGEFASHFGAWIQSNSLGIKIQQTSGVITLKEIIPGEKTRRLFELFLGNHPRSRHFSDVERLDRFICALHSRGGGRVQVSEIQRYLIQVLNWSESDASWCVQRINIGLEVLAVYSGK